jgi:hypothetical protein
MTTRYRHHYPETLILEKSQNITVGLDDRQYTVSDRLMFTSYSFVITTAKLQNHETFKKEQKQTNKQKQ